MGISSICLFCLLIVTLADMCCTVLPHCCGNMRDHIMKLVQVAFLTILIAYLLIIIRQQSIEYPFPYSIGQQQRTHLEAFTSSTSSPAHSLSFIYSFCTSLQFLTFIYPLLLDYFNIDSGHILNHKT